MEEKELQLVKIDRDNKFVEYKIGNATIIVYSEFLCLSPEEKRKRIEEDKKKENSVIRNIERTIQYCYEHHRMNKEEIPLKSRITKSEQKIEVNAVGIIRNKLKEYRQEKNMKQKEFAEFLGVSQYQYNRYESNKVQPQLETALQISEKLGITVNELFERTSEN